jgi:two-component system response regulator TrcR
MVVMSGTTREQRPRQAILGQLPRISRDDGSPIRVLLVDDEPALTNLVKMALHYEGWTVEVAHNGREAVSKFDDVEPDVLVLDIMLPDIDGLEILQRVRQTGPYTPTLFLTARDSVMDRVTGLTAGADDYMTKPFSIEELLARINATLRRTRPAAQAAVEAVPEVINVSDLVIDLTSQQVTRRGVAVHLTPTEFALLRELALNRGKLLSHAHLLRHVWGRGYETETEYVRVYVRRLRAKLETNGTPLIITQPRAGYRILAD